MKNYIEVMFKYLLIGSICITSFQVHSEYRVYQYLVKNKNVTNDNTKPMIIRSTLDPVTYISYHGGAQAIEVELLDSWRCNGYTGMKKNVCPSPLEYLEMAENGAN
jgi:hypothetical protein